MKDKKLKTLVEKNRLKEFPVIYAEFQHKLNEINNTQPVSIISAVELTDSQKQKIINTLNLKLKKTILPNWKTDRSIIAGIIVKIYEPLSPLIINSFGLFGLYNINISSSIS